MSTKKFAKSEKTTKSDNQIVVNKNFKLEISRFKDFYREVKSEFFKIAWPDKKHTFATAGVVVVLVMLISFYLGTVDLVLGKLIGYVIK
jgi:preprotein translocase subunit SecE